MPHLSLLLTIFMVSMLYGNSISAPGAAKPPVTDIIVEHNDDDSGPAVTDIKLPTFTQVKKLAYTVQRKDTHNAVIEALASAKKTIDIAVHIIDDAEIIKALNSAKDRGVDVRLFIQKPGALKGKNSAAENFNIQDIAYQTTKINTSFLPDLGDKNFKYSVQKMAYILIDGQLVAILTRLPRHKDQQYFTQGLFLNNADLAQSLKIVFDYHALGSAEKPAALKDPSHLYNKSQLIIFGGDKGRDQLKEWCRLSTKSITIQTEKLDDLNFVDFLLQMRQMGRDIKIITSAFSEEQSIENIFLEKGIEIKLLKNISGTTILLDHEEDLAHMLLMNAALSGHDFKYARSLAWAHKLQQVVKNSYLIFDTLWNNAKNPDF